MAEKSPDRPGNLARFDAAAVAGLFLAVALAWVVLAPLRVWHVTGADGQEHPDTATWIAYGAGGAVIMGGLMFFSIRASAKAARRTGVKP